MKNYGVPVVVLALIGAVLGAAFGYLLAPNSTRYKASANVALLPAANLSTVEASGFWEVLTRGQVTRTAAVVYNDPRWQAPAADAAKVPKYEIWMSAAALPETTLLTLTVTAASPAAAEAALIGALTAATPEVSSLVEPYTVRVLWPQKGSASPLPAPGPTQIGAAGALGGLLVGAGAGWFLARRRHRPRGGAADTVIAAAGDDVIAR